MQRRHWIRIAGSLMVFILTGTVGMVLLLNAAFQRMSHSEFMALAKANTDFIRGTIDAQDEEDDERVPARGDADMIREIHLAQTEFLAGYLGQSRGVEVRFQRLAAPDARHEAIGIPIYSGAELTLIRERPLLSEVLLRACVNQYNAGKCGT